MKRGLNIGCGTAPIKSNETIEWCNMDVRVIEGVNWVHNAEQVPYPFEDKHFDEIVMDDVIEHFMNPLDVIKECYRLLKVGGFLKIKVVYFSHKYAWGDFTHKRAFSEVAFNCLVGKGRPLGLDFQFSELEPIEYIYDGENIQGMKIMLIK